MYYSLYFLQLITATSFCWYCCYCYYYCCCCCCCCRCCCICYSMVVGFLPAAAATVAIEATLCITGLMRKTRCLQVKKDSDQSLDKMVFSHAVANDLLYSNTRE